MRKARFALLLLVVARLDAGTVVFEPGASPVPQPIPFSPLPLAVETAAGMVPPRPGCPNGALVLFAGNDGAAQSVYTKPLLDPTAGAVQRKPPTGNTTRPEGSDGQLQRLINGDLLVLFNSTTQEDLPIELRPSWWNQWFTNPPPSNVPIPRNGYRQVEMLWRTTCGVDVASWEEPTATFDSALVQGTDKNGKPQTGYCGKLGPWQGGLDRPQLAVDPWGVDPQAPRRQRIFLASKCLRNDDNSVQIWVSNNTGFTWPTPGWRLPAAGVTAMSAMESGRLYVFQCEGGTAKLYWSNDHGLSKAGELDVTVPGLPCTQLTSNEAGVSQPAATEVSLARIDRDAVIATYYSVEAVANQPTVRKRQVYPILRIEPGPDGKMRAPAIIILRAKDELGSILQAQLVEDDRQVAGDRTAVIFWFETPTVSLPGFPGRTLRTRAAMIRNFGPGTAASPFIPFELSNGTWLWTKTQPQEMGDYTKGGFALDAYGIPHFVMSWPEATENKVSVLTPTLEQGPSWFNAIWRRATSATEFGFKLSTDELKARDEDHRTRGYLIADINTMVRPEGLLHNVIWRKTQARVTWDTGRTAAELGSRNELLNARGLSMSSIEGFVTPAGLRYNAVWNDTPGERTWVAGWTLADLQNQNTKLNKQGFQLDRLHSFLLPEGLRYDAIWIKTPGERRFIAGWTFGDFLKKNEELSAKYDLVDLQAVVLPEGPRYDAVWEPRIGLGSTAPSIAGWSHLDAAKKVAEMGRQNWTLVRLYGFAPR